MCFAVDNDSHWRLTAKIDRVGQLQRRGDETTPIDWQRKRESALPIAPAKRKAALFSFELEKPRIPVRDLLG